MRIFHPASALISICCLSVCAADPRDVSPLLEPILQRHKILGMVSVVVQGDIVVMQGAVGVRRAGGAENVEIGDRFHIGSTPRFRRPRLPQPGRSLRRQCLR